MLAHPHVRFRERCAFQRIRCKAIPYNRARRQRANVTEHDRRRRVWKAKETSDEEDEGFFFLLVRPRFLSHDSLHPRARSNFSFPLAARPRREGIPPPASCHPPLSLLALRGLQSPRAHILPSHSRFYGHKKFYIHVSRHLERAFPPQLCAASLSRSRYLKEGARSSRVIPPNEIFFEECFFPVLQNPPSFIRLLSISHYCVLSSYRAKDKKLSIHEARLCISECIATLRHSRVAVHDFRSRESLSSTPRVTCTSV